MCWFICVLGSDEGITSAGGRIRPGIGGELWFRPLRHESSAYRYVLAQGQDSCSCGLVSVPENEAAEDAEEVLLVQRAWELLAGLTRNESATTFGVVWAPSELQPSRIEGRPRLVVAARDHRVPVNKAMRIRVDAPPSSSRP
jgi:hypothetical protein